MIATSFVNRSMRAGALVTALAVMSACSGSGSGTRNLAPPAPVAGTTVATLLRLVGVGDSLTAGMQSSGLFGLRAGIANPYPNAYFPTLPNPALGIAGSAFATIPPSQGAGYWALLWSAANGGADPLNPAISPLPLMAQPVGHMLVPSTITGPYAGAPLAYDAASPCTSINGATYTFSTALTARLNPTITPYDLGVPGQTLHEALYQYGPTTNCTGDNGLGALVGSESGQFYPILGNFGSSPTQIGAAVALKPTIATVWLGSNDLLKYALSGGQYAATDPAAFYTDMVSVITQLQATGAKVAVANLFDVLDASYFTSATELTTFMTLQGVPASLQAYYLALVPTNGYLQLSGFLKVAGALSADAAHPALAPVNPGLVAATDTVPGAFAASVQSYNDQYNAQIAAAVKATGATLVDVHTVYGQIYAAGGAPINLPKCCSTIYGGGLTSIDGVHPSNTGYAIIANAFIQTLDAAYGLTMPTVNVGAIYATDPYAPH